LDFIVERIERKVGLKGSGSLLLHIGKMHAYVRKPLVPKIYKMIEEGRLIV